MKKLINNYKFWLVLIVVLAIILRIPEFFTFLPSLDIYQSKIVWGDETISIYFAEQSFWQIIKIASVDTAPPFFAILLHFWMIVFGKSIILLSVLPFLFSIISVWAIFCLGQEFFNRKIGVIAAFLLAISPHHIQYATELRAYSLLFLLVLFASLFWWRYLKDRTNKNLFFYVLFSVLVMYTHYTGIALVMVQSLVLLYLNRKKLSNYLFSQFLIFVFYLPWILIFDHWGSFVTQTNVSNSFESRHFVHWRFETLWQYFYSFVFGQNIYSYYSFLFLSSLIIILFVFFVYKLKDRKEIKILSFLLVGILTVFAVLKLVYDPKYFLFASIFFILIFALVIFQIKSKRVQKITIVSILLIALIVIPETYFLEDAVRHRYNLKYFSEYIEANEKESDLLLLNNFSTVYYKGELDQKHFFPLNDKLTTNYLDFIKYATYPVITEENVDLVEDLIEGYERVWLIQYSSQGREDFRDQQILLKYFDENYKRIDEIYFPGKIKGVPRNELYLFQLQ